MGGIAVRSRDTAPRRRLSTPTCRAGPAGKAFYMGCRHGPAPGPTGRYSNGAGTDSVTACPRACDTANSSTNPAGDSDTCSATDSAATHANSRGASVACIPSPDPAESFAPGPRGRSRQNRGGQGTDAATYHAATTGSIGTGSTAFPSTCRATSRTNADALAGCNQTGAPTRTASVTRSQCG